MGLNYPSDSLPVAEKLDRELWKLLETVVGSKIPSNYFASAGSYDYRIAVGDSDNHLNMKTVAQILASSEPRRS